MDSAHLDPPLAKERQPSVCHLGTGGARVPAALAGGRSAKRVAVCGDAGLGKCLARSQLRASVASICRANGPLALICRASFEGQYRTGVDSVKPRGGLVLF